MQNPCPWEISWASGSEFSNTSLLSAIQYCFFGLFDEEILGTFEEEKRLKKEKEEEEIRLKKEKEDKIQQLQEDIKKKSEEMEQLLNN